MPSEHPTHSEPSPLIDADWISRFEASMMRTFARPLAQLVRGEGCWVWDSDGKQYLDFLAGIAVNALGHSHPTFVNAVTHQAATLVHVSNFFATPPQLELAARLKRLTGADDRGRVFFCNSGTEAVEAAFKLARLNNHNGARHRILALTGAFHGRTMGAIALGGKPALRSAFEPVPDGVQHIDSTIEALENAIDGTVAAVFIEPIQGEAGVVDLPEGYLKRARELTQQHGALLILDEIQTGIGRTGRWFAYQHDGVLPDAITIAKGMGGGVPIGALVTFGATSDLFTQGQHGSTFGGNPFVTAITNAVLGEIDASDLVRNAERRGNQLRDIVEGFRSPLITEIRGKGLLIGLGLNEPVAHTIAAAAMQQGLIVNAPNEFSVRLAPPLIIGDREIEEFERRFVAALAYTE